jgi:hypothetical protein
MRMVMVVWERLEAPSWELLGLDDDEAAGIWLVYVTESTEGDAPLVVVNGASFCADGVAVEVGGEEVEADEVAD